MSEFAHGGYILSEPGEVLWSAETGYIITRAQLQAIGWPDALDELNRRDGDEPEA